MTSQKSEGLRFQDKVAIVTGGCKGIGRGCADVFAENGGKVAILDIDTEIGSQLPKDGPLFYIKCDVTDEQELKNAIASTHKKFGRIDCLVNNAGYHPGTRPIDEISSDTFRKLIELMLVATFNATRETLPYLRQTQGTIINISSISGVFGQSGCPDYSAIKKGIVGFTKSVACDEAKYGVRVNSISPGAIQTPLLELVLSKSGGESLRQRLVDSTHLKKIGTPREIGLTCLYLAVDATYTTGEDIQCSGGYGCGFGIKVY